MERMTGGVRVQGTPVTVKFGAPGRQIGSGSSAAMVVMSVGSIMDGTKCAASSGYGVAIHGDAAR